MSNKSVRQTVIAVATAMTIGSAAIPAFAQDDDELFFLDEDAATETAAAPAEADTQADVAVEADGEAAADVPEVSEAPSGPMLDEIVVTAQKRAENVQDVPVSVSAVSGEAMKEKNIENLNDLSLHTPNIKLQATPTFSRINIRGLGSGTNKGFEQSVGLFIDGVYYSRLSYLSDGLLDLSRVEVLRGPQGTLFGKNTIAGALNIFTGNPQEEFGFDFSYLMGELDQQRLQGMVTGPVPFTNDMVRFRLAGQVNERDGQVINETLGRDEGNVDTWNARLKLGFDIGSIGDAVLALDYSELDQHGFGGQLTRMTDQTRAQYSLFDPRVEDDDSNFKGQMNAPSFAFRESFSSSLNVNIDIGEYTLTSVTGYSAFEEGNMLDADFGPMPFLEFFQDEDYSQFTEELRVTSPPGELEFVAGLYYFYSDLETASRLHVFPRFTGDALAANLIPVAVGGVLDGIGAGDALSGVLANLGSEEGTEQSHAPFLQETNSYAAFGQGTWYMTDDLGVTLGLRLSYETKDLVFSQTISPDPALAPILTQGVGAEEFSVVKDRSELAFSPKLSVKYQWNDDIMTYGMVGKGFKGGGFNASAVEPNEIEYEEEEAITYELGLKSDLLEGAARLNVALFHTSFSNLQVSVYNGTQFVVSNAADATTQGVELEGMMAVTEHLILSASGSYTDATFDSFPAGSCIAADGTAPGGVILDPASGSVGQAQESCDLSGQVLQRAPKWTGTLNVNYARELGNLGIEGFVGFDALYQDDFFMAVDGDPRDEQKAYVQYNARVGFRSPEGLWQFAVFGRNLSDEIVYVTSADVPLQGGSHFAVVEPGRLISAEFRVSF